MDLPNDIIYPMSKSQLLSMYDKVPISVAETESFA